MLALQSRPRLGPARLYRLPPHMKNVCSSACLCPVLHLSLAPFPACRMPALCQVSTTTSTTRPCLHLRSLLPSALPAATAARRPARTIACPAPCLTLPACPRHWPALPSIARLPCLVLPCPAQQPRHRPRPAPRAFTMTRPPRPSQQARRTRLPRQMPKPSLHPPRLQARFT